MPDPTPTMGNRIIPKSPEESKDTQNVQIEVSSNEAKQPEQGNEIPVTILPENTVQVEEESKVQEKLIETGMPQLDPETDSKL